MPRGFVTMIARRDFILRTLAGFAAATRPGLDAVAAAEDPVHALRTTQGGRLLVDVRVNGVPVEALLDSAAEMTLLDLEFARRIDLTASVTETARGSGEGVLEAGIVEGVMLEAVGLTLRNQTVAMLDLSDVARRLLGHPLHAILGREVFDAARLRIDIAGGTIEVVSPATAPAGVRLPLETQHGIETFPLSVEGGLPVQAAFDLGNGSNVLIGAGYAMRTGLLTDGRPVSRERGGGLGGETERQVVHLATMEIAGRTFHDVPVSIEDNDSATDVNVGIAILRHFVITTDFAGRSLWLLSAQ